MANERIVPASKQSSGGIQPADLVVGEIAFDEATGVLVQKNAAGGLNVYGKLGVLSETEINTLISTAISNVGGGDMLASNNLSEVNPATSRTNLDTRSTAQITTEINNAFNGVTLASLGGLTQSQIDARADARISAQFDAAPELYNNIQKLFAELQADDSLQSQLVTDVANKIPLGATIGGRTIE